MAFCAMTRVYILSNSAEVGVDQLTDGEVLGTNEALQLDLLRLLVQVDIDLVFVVKTIVEEHCLNVVLLRKESVQLGQPVLLTHQEKTFPLEALLGSDLLFCDGYGFLGSVSVGSIAGSGLGVDRLNVPRHLELIKD